MLKSIARLLGTLVTLLSINVFAIEIPKSLEEWKPWVLEKHPELNCPFVYSNGVRTCAWPTNLKIDANATGASFSLRVETLKNEWIILPGSGGFWPQDVNDNAAKIAVRERNNIPEVYLVAGTHDITGAIRWTEMPRTLAIPDQVGIVQLNLNGKAVLTPTLEGSNKIWLNAGEKQSATAHQDTFNMRVFRKIEDTIPLRITTVLQLEVSGKERELQLGQLLLNGFVPTSFDSDLPARIEKDGSLRIQVKPGSWDLELVSHSTVPINDISFKTTSDLWPQQEVWVFAAQQQLRSVQISGVQTIDPQQTQMPENWKQLPAYLVTPDSHFKTEELQRGEGKALSDELALHRDAWLSFSGDKFIFRDNISGSTHASRLETLQPLDLTSADIDGNAQLITQLDKNPNAGIEIRSRDINIQAVSQLPRAFSVPVSGWSNEFNSVNTELRLPPGWSLITATGVSHESGSWVSGWRLWDVFTILIILIAIGRVTKPMYGLLAAATLVLIYQRMGAPIFIWLNLIAAIALSKFVSGRFKQFVERYTYISFLLLVLITLPFSVREARIFVNPQLEHEYFWDWSSSLVSHSYKHHLTPPEFAPEPEILESKVVANEAPSVQMAMPAPAPAMAEADVVDSITAEDVGKFPDSNIAESLQRISGVQIKRGYDAGQQTQTGVAVPNYNINQIRLVWDGPVKADETTQLWLVSPWINRLGHLLAMLLPLLLAGVLMNYAASLFGKKIVLPRFPKATSATLPIILFAGLALPTDHVKADGNISPDILRELEARLTKAPICLPNCASIERVTINVKQDQLNIDFIVHSNDLIALPVPADRDQWWPSQVTVDDKPASLVRTPGGLLVSLPKGRHNLSINANLQGRDSLNLNFPLQLHNVLVNGAGWEVSGLPTQEQATRSLQLQRVEQDVNRAAAENLRADPMTPFVIINRAIHMDLEWTLTTTVTRVAPANGAMNLEIPPLEGESPLSTQLNSNGKIPVHLEANQNNVEWNSALKQITPLQLQAAQNVPWVEVWSLDVSPLWHMQTSGIAPVQMDKHAYSLLWQPWPGETLKIDLVKPKATKGNYSTIDWAQLNYQPGNRSSLSQLHFMIRTNQGGQYGFVLPENTQLARVTIDGSEQIIAPSKGILKLPLHPGSQDIGIDWKSEDGVGLLTRTPAFKLEGGSSNQAITLNLPENRWPLFVGGPLVGPSILLWGLLIVMSLVGYALGRSQLTPLKPYEWILLSLGICTLNFATFVLVAVWLLALHQRGKLTQVTTQLRFRLLQVSLFLLSLIALISLFKTLPNGLLGAPDMHVLGNDSFGNKFSWYQDHSNLDFPQAWVISLPLWCYKLVMLVWSLWLAAALLRWIRWGWQQLGHKAFWTAPTEIVLRPKKQTRGKAPDSTVEPSLEPGSVPPPISE